MMSDRVVSRTPKKSLHVARQIKRISSGSDTTNFRDHTVPLASERDSALQESYTKRQSVSEEDRTHIGPVRPDFSVHGSAAEEEEKNAFSELKVNTEVEGKQCIFQAQAQVNAAGGVVRVN